MFKIIGKINDKECSLIYDEVDGNANVTGDDLAVELFDYFISLNLPTRFVGFCKKRDINDPFSARLVMEECFTEIISYEGEVPKIPNYTDADFEILDEEILKELFSETSEKE